MIKLMDKENNHNFYAQMFCLSDSSLYFADTLIAAIETDISDSEAALDQPEYSKYKTDNFFTNSSQDSSDSKVDKCFSDCIKGGNSISESVKDSI